MSRSLETISDLDGSGRVFTVSVQGLLQLQVRPEGLDGLGGGAWAPSFGMDTAHPASGWTLVMWPLRTRGPHGLGHVPPGGASSLHILPMDGWALWVVTSTVGCLQAGQYASVFVDNGSGAALTIQSGSSFSGLLLSM